VKVTVDARTTRLKYEIGGGFDYDLIIYTGAANAAKWK
jgi:hypothetical protein